MRFCAVRAASYAQDADDGTMTMATSQGTRPSQKKTKPLLARTAAGKWLHSLLNRVFCRRTVIIIADHKTKHLPFTGGVQFAGVVALIGMVVWASYSSGSYMAAQQILAEKERKLANSAMENRRVAAEFTLLKSDLMKLASASKNGKSADYAKMLAEQYSQPGIGDLAATDADSGLGGEYDAVLKRVEYLDNKVRELQATHNEMIADIRATTGGKIRELEQVIARTGVAATPLEKAARAERVQAEQLHEKYGRIEASAKGGKERAIGGGRGGPLLPERSSVLKNQETELYYNLRRMMVLNDVVNALPLAEPLRHNSYRQTSSFGSRVDPFKGRTAFHSGLDLAGVQNAKVYATNDGKVAFAGWKSAYGNMVDIKHPYGISTRYGHLARVLVQPDQYVKKGQVIGIQGSTGRSTGYHLHYEVRLNGTPVNPKKFLKEGDDVQTD